LGYFGGAPPTAADARFGDRKIRNQGDIDKGRSVGGMITSNIQPNAATSGFALVVDDRNCVILKLSGSTFPVEFVLCPNRSLTIVTHVNRIEIHVSPNG
jgi:hypothetical protein